MDPGTGETYRVINLSDWTGGICDHRRNPLHFPENCLTGGENVDLARNGLRTRGGFSAVYNDFGPWSEIRVLRQVRFPTNESSYLIAQVSQGTVVVSRAGYPRAEHTAVIHDGKLYVWGGFRRGEYPGTSNKLDIYEIASNSWREGAPGGTSRCNATAILVDEKLFIWGGGSDSTALDVYDLTADEWIAAQPGGQSRINPGAVAHNGKIYYWGGGTSDGSVDIYDIAEDSWSQATPYEGRLDLTTAMVAGDSIVFAPMQAEGPEGGVGKAVYDTIAGSWSFELSNDIPDGQRSRESVVYDNGVYRWSGLVQQEGNTFGNRLSILKDGIGIPGTPGGIGRTRFTATLYDGKIYYFGGYWYYHIEHIEMTNRLDVYDIASDSWTSIEGPEVNLDEPGPAFSKLYASATNLPAECLEFTEIYDLGEGAGPASIAVLNDRAVITEGLNNPPLVWGGCLSSDASDWMYPKAVLVSQDGENFYDVSAQVCDKDKETVADIGGIQSWGFLAICTDMPKVEGFHIEVDQANTGAEATVYTSKVELGDPDNVAQQNLKAEIDIWVQDNGSSGHFEGVSKALTGSATDLGGSPNKVKIPCSGHGLFAGDVIEIRNTGHYDGTYTLPAQTLGNDDNFVIESEYSVEVFSAPHEARQRLTLGPGKDCPEIVAGLRLVSASGTSDIVVVTGDGEQDGEVTLTSEHPTGTVAAIHGLVIEDRGLRVNRPVEADWTEAFAVTEDESKSFSCGGFSFRAVIPASEISSDGDLIRITLHAGHTNSVGARINHCSIVEQDSGANGKTTPKPFTFSGLDNADIACGTEITSDPLEYRVDAEKNYIISLDCGWQAPDHTGGAHLRSGRLSYKPLTGATFYYKGYAAQSRMVPIYDAQTVTGFIQVTNQTIGVFKIEVKHQQTLPSDIYVAHTSDAALVDISHIDAIVGVDVTESKPGGSLICHAVSSDGRNTWKVFLNDSWRSIVRNNGGMWQYKDAAGSWQNASSNNGLKALHQAFSVTENRMTGAELGAMTSPQWLSGGINVLLDTRLDFACGLQAEDPDYPGLTSYVVKYKGSSVSIVEGRRNGEWTDGEGWSDGTESGGVPLGQSGAITYLGERPFEADYHVLSEVPGYWFRFKMRGTAAGTSVSRILYKAPCQPLANIGDGRPDIPLGFVFHDTGDNMIRDYSVEVSDNSLSSLSKADVPMKPEDFLYVGYLTRFNELEITLHESNNSIAAVLSAQYWNGESWAALDIRDGTAADGATFARKGKISWQIPEGWRTHIPLEARFPRGYWIRFSVSAGLSDSTAISEARVYGVPEPLKKHRFAVSVKDRVALLSRPDAPDQVDISRSLEEYGFVGLDSGSYRVGGMDGIHCAVAAWNGLFIGKTESWHQLAGDTPADFGFQSIEAARHVPVNSECTVKAPMNMGDGDRYGLFFLNTYGAFVATGLHVDSLWNSSRGKILSEGVRWWNSEELPRLDLDHLHLACGTYWPANNWIIWAVPMITAAAGAQTTNNRLIIYDLTFGTWLPPFTISLASITTAYHLNATAAGRLGAVGLYGGDYRGRVLRLFSADHTTDNGTAISGWAETGWLHFGSPECCKLLRLFAIYGKTAGNAVALEVFTDGSQTRAATMAFANLHGSNGEHFSREQIPANVRGRFFKFRFSFTDVTDVYGLQVGASIIREWGRG